MICGGVCLGIANEHHVSDGFSAIHFINTWSNIARGGGIKVPPFFDRTILHAGDSPEPKFAHNEYHPPPPLVQTPETNNPNLNFTVFKLTLDQLNALKTSCSKEDHQNYSTYEVVSGHLWRCVTAARGLPENQDEAVHPDRRAVQAPAAAAARIFRQRGLHRCAGCFMRRADQIGEIRCR